jgi:hypothetical protein
MRIEKVVHALIDHVLYVLLLAMLRAEAHERGEVNIGMRHHVNALKYFLLLRVEPFFKLGADIVRHTLVEIIAQQPFAVITATTLITQDISKRGNLLVYLFSIEIARVGPRTEYTGYARFAIAGSIRCAIEIVINLDIGVLKIYIKATGYLHLKLLAGATCAIEINMFGFGAILAEYVICKNLIEDKPLVVKERIEPYGVGLYDLLRFFIKEYPVTFGRAAICYYDHN